MGKCVTVWFGYQYDEPNPPINCPNCGKFLKYHPEENRFSCVCGRILNLEGDRNGEFPEDAIRVCKIPEVIN